MFSGSGSFQLSSSFHCVSVNSFFQHRRFIPLGHGEAKVVDFSAPGVFSFEAENEESISNTVHDNPAATLLAFFRSLRSVNQAQSVSAIASIPSGFSTPVIMPPTEKSCNNTFAEAGCFPFSAELDSCS